MVDLGLVGDPANVDASLIGLLLEHGYVPVIASLGIDRVDRTTVLNVNADVMACRVAAALTGSDLVIAGATPGVLDSAGQSIPTLDFEGMDAMIAGGSATAGMVAKLTACRAALADGVRSVRIVDGRSLASAGDLDRAPGTAIVMSAKALGTRH
jgi:acetylglutamate kinase